MKFSDKISKLGNNLIDKVFAKIDQIPDAISLAGGTPPFPIPDNVLEQIVQQAKGNIKILQYPRHMQGILPLRECIAIYLSKELKQEVNPDEILITVGTTAGLFATFQTLLNPNDEVLLFSPYWSLYKDQIILSQGKVKTVALVERNDWDIDFNNIQKQYSQNMKLILFSEPINPTGTIFPIKSKRDLLQFAIKNNLIILADETYRFLNYSKLDFHSIKQFPESIDNVLLYRSFSKDFSMSGFRLGFIYAKREFIQKIARVHLAMNMSASTFSQELGRIIYSEKEKYLYNYLIEEYNKRRLLVCSRLDKLSSIISYVKPLGGFFVFPRYKLDLTSLEFFELLLKAKVVIRPGIGFGTIGERHFRISYNISTESINKAFDRIEKCLIQ